MRLPCVFLIAALLLAACGRASSATDITLTVFAAASLTDVFNNLGGAFEIDHPNVEVVFNFASSNQLAQQIGQGAPADVFASANPTQMSAALDTGRVTGGAQQVFARNRLVLIFPASNPANLAALSDLAVPGLKLVLAAAEVPVGQYSLDFLDKASANPAFGAEFRDSVLANVVSYEENVRSIFTKVSLGEADAGIVYTSDIVGEGSDAVGRLDIPDDLNTIASYPIAPLNDSPHGETAQVFVDFVMSETGQATLARYGFVSALP